MAKANRKRNPEGRMRLAEHLLELRKRIFICALAIVLAAVLGWMLSDLVWDLLRQPVEQIAKENQRLAKIAYTDVTGAFDLKLRISFFIAIFIASPVWLYQLWAFFAPGLVRREKMVAIGFLAAAVPLFLAGAVVAWLVLPNVVRLLTSFGADQDALLLNARGYLDFATRLMLAVGVGFVLPVFVVLLNFVGVLSARTIISSWRMAVLGICVFAALVTPAADVISMFLLAIPMILLYLLAALLAHLNDRRVQQKQRQELFAYDLDKRSAG